MDFIGHFSSGISNPLCVPIILILLPLTTTLDNGLAKTPPMGWMHWERFRCNLNCTDDPDNCISEKLFMQMADHMVADGYRDAGYEYVAIDDCWMTTQRAPSGSLMADPNRFPSGIKALADYIHSKGLKLGIYADMGTYTCKQYPGSIFYLELDADTFASWGVDMLKLDCCYGFELQKGYEAMSLFLNRTNRPIMFSCSWPACTGYNTDYDSVAKHCNTWRNYKDLRDDWGTVYDVIDYYGNDSVGFSYVAGPGNWNDPDQLIIGDFGLSYDQQRVQMGMWAIMASPLFMSVDLRNINSQSKALLLHKGLLAINQDYLGKMGRRVWKDRVNNLEVWVKPLMGIYFWRGSFAFAFLNSNNYGGPLKIQKSLQELGANNTAGYNVKEVFDGTVIGKYMPSDVLTVKVNPTGIYLVTAIPLAG
ncbi:hypothetical protein ACJMK2_032259 [Sinanodonta woodiana]|uniref:Alpha-galactosidase n=1 Tax=Sinanodonta woodiana TaxID=1069815 RepID=A0ABD3X1R9_SINWO